jgi:hypothetical protein
MCVVVAWWAWWGVCEWVGRWTGAYVGGGGGWMDGWVGKWIDRERRQSHSSMWCENRCEQTWGVGVGVLMMGCHSTNEEEESCPLF